MTFAHRGTTGSCSEGEKQPCRLGGRTPAGSANRLRPPAIQFVQLAETAVRSCVELAGHSNLQPPCGRPIALSEMERTRPGMFSRAARPQCPRAQVCRPLRIGPGQTATTSVCLSQPTSTLSFRSIARLLHHHLPRAEANSRAATDPQAETDPPFSGHDLDMISTGRHSPDILCLHTSDRVLCDVGLEWDSGSPKVTQTPPTAPRHNEHAPRPAPWAVVAMADCRLVVHTKPVAASSTCIHTHLCAHHLRGNSRPCARRTGASPASITRALVNRQVWVPLTTVADLMEDTEQPRRQTLSASFDDRPLHLLRQTTDPQKTRQHGQGGLGEMAKSSPATTSKETHSPPTTARAASTSSALCAFQC